MKFDEKNESFCLENNSNLSKGEYLVFSFSIACPCSSVCMCVCVCGCVCALLLRALENCFVTFSFVVCRAIVLPERSNHMVGIR